VVRSSEPARTGGEHGLRQPLAPWNRRPPAVPGDR